MNVRRPPRYGFSFIELLTSMVIIGIVMAASLPRLQRLKDQGEISTAMSRVMRGVMAARQAAIQRGKNAYFRSNDSYVWVFVDTTGTNADSVIVTSQQNISDLHNVTITAPSGLVSIEYDPRGVSTQATKQLFAFTHTGSGYLDSLCVSRLGNTIRERCP